MAAESETLKVRMLRTSGRNKEIQWFEYRPSFQADIIRISWELDTMEVELDTSVADYLLRAGYAAPIPQGSAPAVAETTESVSTEEPPPPPPTPSWLKPDGGK